MPWRSPTIVGRAVATTVVSSDDSALPIISPMKTIHTARGTAATAPFLAPPTVTLALPSATLIVRDEASYVTGVRAEAGGRARESRRWR